MRVRYMLTLQDHLAWYDYHLATSEGARLRSPLPLIGGAINRFRRWEFSRRVILPPSRHALGERTLALGEQGTREFSPDFDFTTPWTELCLAAVTSSHLFIAHASMNAHIVPLRFFENEAEREAFISFVRQHFNPAA
jgi:hypothetical protein